MDDEEKKSDGWNGSKHLERIETHLKSIDTRVQNIESDLISRVIHLERSVKDHDKTFADLKSRPMLWWVPASLGFLFVVCILTLMWMVSLRTDVTNLADSVRTAVSNATEAALKSAARDAMIESEVKHNRQFIDALKERK